MDFAEHKLHVRSDAKPVRQPLRRLSEEKRRVVGEEIARLLAAGSPRVTMYTKEEAEESRQDSVDLLEEGRLLALSRSSIYQQACADTTIGRSGQDLSKKATLCSD